MSGNKESVTLDEAVDEKQRETAEDEEHLQGLVNYASESRQVFDGESLEAAYENVEDISVTPPGFLSGDESAAPPDFGDGDSGSGIDVSLELDEIVDQIRNLEDASTPAILRLIALTQVAELQTMFSIRDSVRPISNITVSGTNSISDANTPEPVVPRSDETSIPTRELFVRASSDNTDKIWFGDDEVSPNSGFTLEPGAHIIYPLNMINQSLWMSSETSGQVVELMGSI